MYNCSGVQHDAHPRRLPRLHRGLRAGGGCDQRGHVPDLARGSPPGAIRRAQRHRAVHPARDRGRGVPQYHPGTAGRRTIRYRGAERAGRAYHADSRGATRIGIAGGGVGARAHCGIPFVPSDEIVPMSATSTGVPRQMHTPVFKVDREAQWAARLRARREKHRRRKAQRQGKREPRAAVPDCTLPAGTPPVSALRLSRAESAWSRVYSQLLRCTFAYHDPCVPGECQLMHVHEDTYICPTARREHWCGPGRCEKRVQTQEGGEACPLTGQHWHLGIADASTHTPVPPGVCTSSLHGNDVPVLWTGSAGMGYGSARHTRSETRHAHQDRVREVEDLLEKYGEELNPLEQETRERQEKVEHAVSERDWEEILETNRPPASTPNRHPGERGMGTVASESATSLRAEAWRILSRLLAAMDRGSRISPYATPARNLMHEGTQKRKAVDATPPARKTRRQTRPVLLGDVLHPSDTSEKQEKVSQKPANAVPTELQWLQQNESRVRTWLKRQVHDSLIKKQRPVVFFAVLSQLCAVDKGLLKCLQKPVPFVDEQRKERLVEESVRLWYQFCQSNQRFIEEQNEGIRICNIHFDNFFAALLYLKAASTDKWLQPCLPNPRTLAQYVPRIKKGDFPRLTKIVRRTLFP